MRINFAWSRIGCLVAVLSACWAVPTIGRAQTDEIQVYDGAIEEPGKFSVELHNNYTPRGPAQPKFQGGLAPNHLLNGVPEWAVGVSESLELGAYLPLYSVTGDGNLLFNGVKLRALLVAPHADERRIFFGVNFELSYNIPHWEPTRFSGEVRLIVGTQIGPIRFILNPIFDTSFHGFQELEFGPAERLDYRFSPTWTAALEHYSDYGQIDQLEPANRQEQTLFAVVDFSSGANGVELGIGHGFTKASEDLILKLEVEHHF